LLEKYGSLVRRHPKDVKLPESGGRPFAALGKPLDGLLCDDCDYITVSKDAMQKHCKAHDWRFSKTNPVHWTGVKVQTFFGNAYQRYFIVRSGAADEAEGNVVGQDADPGLMDDEDAEVEKQLMYEWDAGNQKEEERRSGDGKE
jgi:hypothetical protein